MRKYLILFSILLTFLLPISVYAEEEPQQYTVTVKYMFHSGYVEDDNIIYQFSGEDIVVYPGDEIFVPTLGIANFSYHIDGYPDEMTWNLGEREVLGGGNPDPLEIDDWANFHTPSMVAEDIDIIFHYCPNTDICLLEHYFEQEDGSYKIQKTQRTKLGIYEIFEYEYDLSQYSLKVEGYTFDAKNENNVLKGYPNFRTADKSPFVFKYYYNLIEKEEEPVEPEVTPTPEPEPTEEPDPEPTPTPTVEPEPTKEPEPEPTKIPDSEPEPKPTESPKPVVVPINITVTSPTPIPTAAAPSNPGTVQPQTPEEPTPIPDVPAPARQIFFMEEGKTEQEIEQEIAEVEEEKESIEDTKIPLVSPPVVETRHWALLNLLLTIGSVIISTILGFLFLFNKKNKNEENYYTYTLTYEEERKNRRSIVKRLISIIITAVMMFIFAITEDITLPMQFTDKFTLLMIIIFIIHVLMSIIWHNWKNEDSSTEGD